MQLYFSPLACSMATRIVVNEIGADCDYRQVDLKTKKTAEGEDFLAVNPLGQVPVLKTDDGRLLTENEAVLQHVARLHPAAGLLPERGFELAQLQQWLSFLSTELHAGVFALLFNPGADEAVKAFALTKAEPRLLHLDRKLQGRETLLDRFSVADAYLFTILNWTQATPIRLKNFDEVHRYYGKLSQRPSVARALAAELPLYRA